MLARQSIGERMALGATRQSIGDVMVLDALLKVSDAEAYKHLPRKAMARILNAHLVLHFWNPDCSLMRQLVPNMTVYDAVPHDSVTASLLRKVPE